MALDSDARKFAELLFQAGESYDQVIEHFSKQWEMSRKAARERLKGLGFQPPPSPAQKRRERESVDRESRTREREERRQNKAQMDAALRAFRERERREAQEKKRQEAAEKRQRERLEREKSRHEEAIRRQSLRHIIPDEIKRTVKSETIQLLHEFGIVGRIASRRIFGNRYGHKYDPKNPEQGRRQRESSGVDVQSAAPIVSSLQLLTRKIDHMGSRVVVALTDVRHEIEKTAKRVSRPPAANSLGASVYAAKYGAAGGADKSALFRMMFGGLNGGKMRAALGIGGAAALGIGALALSSTPALGALHPSNDMADEKQPPQALPEQHVEQKDTGAVSNKADELKYEAREIKFEADLIEFEQTVGGVGGEEVEDQSSPVQRPPATPGGQQQGAPGAGTPSGGGAGGAGGEAPAGPSSAPPVMAPQSGGGGGGGLFGSSTPSLPRVGSQAGAPPAAVNPATGDKGLFGGGSRLPQSATKIGPAGGNVDPSSLYKTYVDMFSKSKLNGYVPADATEWGIKTGSPQEWARLALATSRQESDLRSNAPNGGLNQFNPGDLKRYNLDPRMVEDPTTQAQALVNQWQKYIKNSGYIAGQGSGPGTYSGYRGAAAYFEPFRTNAHRKYFPWAGRIGDETDAQQRAAQVEKKKTSSTMLTPETATPISQGLQADSSKLATILDSERTQDSLKARIDDAMAQTSRASFGARFGDWTTGRAADDGAPATVDVPPKKKWAMEDRFAFGEDPPPPTSKRDAFDSGHFPGLGKAQVDPHYGLGQ